MVAGLSDLPARLVSQGAVVRSLIGQVAGLLAVAVLGAPSSLEHREPTPPSAADHRRGFRDSALTSAAARS